MSTWIEINKQEDVDYDLLSKPPSIDIFIGNDNFGNNYVTVPVTLIIQVLKENGYEIK